MPRKVTELIIYLFICFAVRTLRRMDLVFNLDSTEVLVDVTSIDANNGFLRGSGLSPSYFHGVGWLQLLHLERSGTSRSLCGRQGPNQQIVPFVVEVQGRWGYCARQLFKRLFSLLLLKGCLVISGLIESPLLMLSVPQLIMFIDFILWNDMFLGLWHHKIYIILSNI